VPNPKVRRAGLVLIMLAGLAFLGAVAGYDAQDATGRIVFGVVGALLLILGVLLVRSRAPRVETIEANSGGLRFTLAGATPETVPWNVVRSLQMPTLSPILGGHMLRAEIAPAAVCPPGLRVFGRPQPDGATRILIGLTPAQATRLRVDLPAYGPQPPS